MAAMGYPTDDEPGVGFDDYIVERAAQLGDDIRAGRRPRLRDDFLAWAVELPEGELIRALLDGNVQIAADWLLERARAEHAKEWRDAA